MSNTMTRELGLNGVTRSVKAQSLRPHHIGLEFVGYGVLEAVTITRDGWTIQVEDGRRFTGNAQSRALTYWIPDDELQRRRLPNDQRTAS